jgi:hypothetical protein
MLLVENQSLLPLSAGIIQMVPGRSGYEPADQDADNSSMDVFYASREPRYQTPKLLDEAYETTYNRNRQLTLPAASDIGSNLDVYA